MRGRRQRAAPPRRRCVGVRPEGATAAALARKHGLRSRRASKLAPSANPRGGERAGARRPQQARPRGGRGARSRRRSGRASCRPRESTLSPAAPRLAPSPKAPRGARRRTAERGSCAGGAQPAPAGAAERRRRGRRDGGEAPGARALAPRRHRARSPPTSRGERRARAADGGGAGRRRCDGARRAHGVAARGAGRLSSAGGRGRGEHYGGGRSSTSGAGRPRRGTPMARRRRRRRDMERRASGTRRRGGRRAAGRARARWCAASLSMRAHLAQRALGGGRTAPRSPRGRGPPRGGRRRAERRRERADAGVAPPERAAKPASATGGGADRATRTSRSGAH